MSFFVDCHSHVCPAGDDGARSVEEGEALCHEAARRGTAILFATPHVWPYLPLSSERERAVRSAFAQLAPRAGLELRLGFELTPAAALLADDPHRYELDGTGCVLVEVPFTGTISPLLATAAHIEAAGLQPVIAHPERADTISERPEEAYELAARGWLLQVNGSSLLGREGARIEELGWRLVEDGVASIVASDGHRTTRPPFLDEAYAVVSERIGEAAARPFFDGTALGLGPAG